jgi:predicted lipid-binding transport protein (Tim44 family)
LATIDVLLRAPAHHAPPTNQHDTGFLAGLAGGWHALAAVAAGAFTVVGAVLPFAVLLVLLGVPAWLLVRRLLRRRTETPAPTEP